MENSKYDKYSVEHNKEGKRYMTDPVFATSFKNADEVLKLQNRHDEVVTGIIVSEIHLTEEEFKKIGDLLDSLDDLEDFIGDE